MIESGSRHPRCGGTWRGPLSTDAGLVLVCNACGDVVALPSPASGTRL